MLNYKKTLILSTLLVVSLLPLDAMAKTKKLSAPSGAERARQFERATKECRKRHAGAADVGVEWSSYYGRTGWWCVVRS